MGKQRADIRERQLNAGCGFSAEVWHQALPQTGSPLPQLPSKGFSHQLHHKKGSSQSEDPLPAPPSCHCRAPTSQLPAQLQGCTPQHPIARDGHPQGMGCSAGCGVGQELCAPWVSCQSPNPAQRASKDRRREQNSSCPARSCWERDPQPCRLSSCLAQVNSFDASCPHQLAWLALVPQP